jgi:hypothetical protein
LITLLENRKKVLQKTWDSFLFGAKMGEKPSVHQRKIKQEETNQTEFLPYGVIRITNKTSWRKQFFFSRKERLENKIFTHDALHTLSLCLIQSPQQFHLVQAVQITFPVCHKIWRAEKGEKNSRMENFI